MKPLVEQVRAGCFDITVGDAWHGHVIDAVTATDIAADGDARITELESMLREFAEPSPFAKEAEEGRCGPITSPSRAQRARKLLGIPEPKPVNDDED